MGELFIVSRNVAPGRVIGAHGLRITRLDAVILGMWRIGIDGVRRLFDAPPTTRHDDRILDNISGFQSDLTPVFICALGVGADSLKQQLSIAFRTAKANRGQITTLALIELPFFYAEPRSESGSNQRGSLANRAMTIDASNLYRSARFVVENAVAVRVLAEMAIDTLHTLL